MANYPAPKRIEHLTYPKLNVKLPDLLEEIIKAIRLQYQIDVSTAFGIALGCIAASMRGKIAVQIAPNWIEPSTLYLCVIAETADGKSQVMKLLAAPLREAEAQEQAEAREHQRVQQHKLEIAEEKLKKIKSSLSQMKPGKSPIASEADLREAIELVERERPKPIPLRILGGDVTPDRFTELLQLHQSLTIMEAEGGLFAQFSGRKYGSGASWESLLAAKTGDAIKTHRVGRGDGNVEEPRLNICVAVQPDVWRELHQDSTATGRGVTGRFLPIAAQSLVGYRNTKATKEYPIPQELIDDWALRIGEILKTREDRILSLSSSGSASFDYWRKKWESELRDEENKRNGFGNRLPGNLISIAACFTLLENPGATEISDLAIEAALDLDQYFLAHRKLADDLKVEKSPEMRVLDWIRARALGEFGDVGDVIRAVRESRIPAVYRFDFREIQQSMKQQVWLKEGGAERLKEALDKLEMCSWIDRDGDDLVIDRCNFLKHYGDYYLP